MYIDRRDKEEEGLAEHYPAYKPLLDKHVWYASSAYLLVSCHNRAADHIYKDGLTDFTILTDLHVELDDRYWVPHEDHLSHMRNIIRKEVTANENGKSKLRKLRKGTDIKNENYRFFPVEYIEDPDLRDLADRFQINDTVRLKEITQDKIVLQKANYLDQIATNITPDAPILQSGKETGSFRALDKHPDGTLKAFQECTQANTVGVACLFLDEKMVPVMRWRSGEVAVMQAGWHCSSSGVLEWKDIAPYSAVAADGRNVFENVIKGFIDGMEREIKEEAGNIKYTMLPCCILSRELKRSGKPQLFFFVQIHQDIQSIRRYFKDLSVRDAIDKNSEFNDPEKRSVWPNSRRRQQQWTLDDELSQFIHLPADERMKRLTGMSESNIFTYEGYAHLYYLHLVKDMLVRHSVEAHRQENIKECIPDGIMCS